jgi:hypothetical protein
MAPSWEQLEMRAIKETGHALRSKFGLSVVAYAGLVKER